jgi:hypothetical protein
MSKYVLVVGDTVNFIDPTNGLAFRGVITKYDPNRDELSKDFNRPQRNYLIKFDKSWHGYDEAWAASEDCELVRKPSSNVKVNYTVSSSSVHDDKKKSNINNNLYADNIKLQKSDVTINSLSDVTINSLKGSVPNTLSGIDKPWIPYYVTSDEFFDLLRVAFEDTYGDKGGTPYHPEDLYVNVSCVLEVVSNTLANMVRMKAGRSLHGVKDK